MHLGGTLLCSVGHKLPDHRELAIGVLIAQSRRHRVEPRELEGAVEIRREYLGAGARAVGCLQDALEHPLSLAGEEEHER